MYLLKLPGLNFFILCVFLFGYSSCVSSKKVIYLNDLQDSSATSIAKAQINFENIIQKNDQLSIVVGGSNAPDLIQLNSGSGASVGGATLGVGASYGYLVEADGNIQIPYLGKLKAEGLTRLELQDTLTKLFKDYTKNPIVNVRFLNYSFSVLGEVGHAGRFPMTNERTTIFEAISMAGDITNLGKFENVMVIREENGERKFARISLLSKDIFNSPYFYMKTKDVVYVEPVRARFISRTGIPQYLGIVAVGLSLILTVINVIK
jgi:polysaccharide biosynthesis/export protein